MIPDIVSDSCRALRPKRAAGRVPRCGFGCGHRPRCVSVVNDYGFSTKVWTMNKVLQEDYEMLSPYVTDKSLLQDTRWMVTGCTGMTGSYFLSFLSWLNEQELNGTARITAVHRGNLNANLANIGHLLDKPYIEFRQIDLSKDFSLNDDDRYDFVFHAASNAAPRTYLNDPIGTMNTNVKATQILLDHLLGCKRLRAFLFVSSGEIYGDPDIDNIPTKEEYIGITDHLKPRACYVEAKKFAETLCSNYSKQYGLPAKMIRPVHIYGPGFREHDSRVWADFVSKAARGQDIEILSDGKARRGFCYLADALAQIFAVIQKGQPGEVYNIGNDQHISIKDLADIVAAVAGNNIEVIIKNQLPGYLLESPKISCPSIDKVASLGPLLRTSVHKGIEKSFSWFCDQVL